MMGRRVGAALVAGGIVWAAAAIAAEVEVVARDVRFPEGPLWFDGALLFVDYGGQSSPA